MAAVTSSAVIFMSTSSLQLCAVSWHIICFSRFFTAHSPGHCASGVVRHVLIPFIECQNHVMIEERSNSYAAGTRF